MRNEYIFRTPAWREKVRQGMYRHFGDPVTRFWGKVQIKGPHECWPWMGCRDRRNYGYVRLREQKRLQAAHRVAYLFAYGELPRLHICHKCDNPSCCNPSHLFPGTNQENIRDAMKKGRMCCGEKRPQSKLTEHQVKTIRMRYSTGTISQYRLAEEFKVNRTAIEKILLRKTWKHVA